MKIRTLLLESTAALMVVGAGQAQAADKVVKPAPVNYMQVCDAYGLGYFIIPGQKDVCLRVQGQVQFQINFHTRDTEFYGTAATSWHDAGWDTQSLGQVTFTAKRQTDHGPLTGVIRITGTSSNSQNIQLGTANIASTSTVTISGTSTGVVAVTSTATSTATSPTTYTVTNTSTGIGTVTGTGTGTVAFAAVGGRTPVDRYVQVDRVWMQLGNFKVGYDSSIYGIGTTKQVALNWSVGGYGLALALDDPRDRWGSRLPRYYYAPDIVGNLTAAPKWGSWGVSAGLGMAQVPSTGPTGSAAANGALAGTNPAQWLWGVTGRTTINTPGIAKGDQLSLSGSVGTGCAFVTNNCGNSMANTGATMWTAMAQFKHVFNPAWNTVWQFTWFDPNPASEAWQAQANLVWQGISNFTIQTRVQAQQTLSRTHAPVWNGQVQLQWQY